MLPESSCGYLDTVIGRLCLVATANGLRAIVFPSRSQPPPAAASQDAEVTQATRPAAVLATARAELLEYLACERREFTVPLDPCGTAFQREVWAAVAAIPYGETRSYQQIARQIGRPGASRAVGAANGANPLPPIVPCHRVIGAAGSLVGYGGGLALKRQLLELERGQRPLAF